MDGNGVRQRKFAPLSPTPPEAGSLRPCLVHVPTGEVINSYAQLSKLVKKLGWKVFVDVTGNVWSAWYVPAGDACFIQMVFLPHPHISSATYYQLSAVVHALGANTFNITYAPLRKFQDLEAYSDFHKPTLRLKATGREIVSIHALTQLLTQNGWRKESENQFIKREKSFDKSPIDLLSVIKLPSVETVRQLSTLDLEYIALNTENIFYLQSATRYQPPRKQESKPPQPRIAPGNSVTMKATTTPQTAPQTSTAGKAPVDFPSETSNLKAQVFC